MSIEAHFDESGTDAKEITVAGYLFEASRIDEFCSKWEQVLAEHHLPYFHMVDCAHGQHHFRNIEKNDRVRIQMRLMGIVKEFAVNGIVSNIQNSRDNSGRGYRDAVIEATNLVTAWADMTSYNGKIAYFLEAGAKGQGLVDGWFHEVAQNPGNPAYPRYAGHAFVPKADNPGVQAADLLSWQYHNFTKKRAKASLARLDLRALLRHPHFIRDRCGEKPRVSKVQTVEVSRQRVETVFYLFPATPKDLEGAVIINPTGDFTVFEGDNRGHVLACPSCLRAICEDMSVIDIWRRFYVEREFIFRCWCGTDCRVPKNDIPALDRC